MSYTTVSLDVFLKKESLCIVVLHADVLQITLRYLLVIAP